MLGSTTNVESVMNTLAALRISDRVIDRMTAGRGLLLWQARRVREYIDAHIATRILISDLSEVVQRSDSHFARAFKQTFGLAPHAYLVRRRVEFAGHLMCVSHASLSDIALACGFTDQAHLCRLFRQCMGQSPGAWRRERRDAWSNEPPIGSSRARSSWPQSNDTRSSP
jgi:AraC-like DNA-binding protein